MKKQKGKNMKTGNILLTVLMMVCLVSCRTVKTATIDTQREVHNRDSVVSDSSYTIIQHVQQITDSVTLETIVEKTTIITVDLDGKEIYRETNCNTTTNRDHNRKEKDDTQKETAIKHTENVNSADSLYQGHWEKEVVTEKPSIFQRIKNEMQDLTLFVLAVLIIIGILKYYGKEKRN